MLAALVSTSLVSGCSLRKPPAWLSTPLAVVASPAAVQGAGAPSASGVVVADIPVTATAPRMPTATAARTRRFSEPRRRRGEAGTAARTEREVVVVGIAVVP